MRRVHRNPQVSSRPTMTLARDWEGQTAVVFGNGTSLIDQDLDPVEASGAKTLVSNSGYVVWPDADVLMCSDRHWLADNTRRSIDGYRGPLIIVTQPQAVSLWDDRMRFIKRQYIERATGDIYSDPNVLYEGHSSVMTNMSVAVLRGASRIILLGVDLHPGENGKRRVGDTLTDDAANARRRYHKQARHFRMMAPHLMNHGVDVINCSPGSSLGVFPKAKLEDIL